MLCEWCKKDIRRKIGKSSTRKVRTRREKWPIPDPSAIPANLVWVRLRPECARKRKEPAEVKPTGPGTVVSAGWAGTSDLYTRSGFYAVCGTGPEIKVTENSAAAMKSERAEIVKGIHKAS